MSSIAVRSHRLMVSARRFSNRMAVPNLASRSFVSATLPRFEKHTVKVPTMGDSITEGTIVEWTAQVGQAIKDGDVVALVETDKVTVDIKAEMDGVVTQQFGDVDDTVEVGAKLYEIDTEAEATVAADEIAPAPETTEAQAVAKEPVVAETVAAASEPEDGGHVRVPSIKFLGKSGWASRRSGKDHASQGATPTSPTGSITLDGSYISPNYGRPAFSEAEMEALISGGANLAPNVLNTSRGATFG